MAQVAEDISKYFEKVSPQSKILAVSLDRASKTNFQSHLIAWAVPAGNAYVSSLFSYSGQQPLVLKRQSSEATVSVVDGNPRMDKTAVARDFDYVWMFDPSATGFEKPPGWSVVLGKGAGTFYRTTKP